MHTWFFREPASTWTHLAGLLLSLPGAAILWRRGGGDIGKRISLLVYGFCLISCYAASTLYHGLRLPPDRLAVLIRLDSIGIFALIVLLPLGLGVRHWAAARAAEREFGQERALPPLPRRSDRDH